MTAKNNSERRRNIAWTEDVDALAVRLAAERGLKRGVSELLEQLVLEERENPRLPLEEPTPGYKAHIRVSEKLSDAILKKGGKSIKKELDK